MADLLLQIQEIFRYCQRVCYRNYGAFDEKYITIEELTLGEEKCELVFKLIYGYIAYLDKSKKK